MAEPNFRPLSELPAVRALGRHTGLNPLTLFWTASGIELNFTGSELWVEFFADYEAMEPWVSIEVNGAWLSRFPINKGKSRVCVFRGMTLGKVKRVRLLKDVQAMPEDPAHLLQITALGFANGEFLPLAAPCCRLEFIGDSITSGEGSIGAACEEDWISAFFSAENSFPRMTADVLNAEYRVISQSGWGILTGWDNNPHHALPPYYTKVCGVAAGTRNAALGAQQANDFSAWQPNAIIVNLGTNDDGAFNNPPWVDPTTHATTKQRLLPDGSYHPEDAARLSISVAEFIKNLRALNPNAFIVWCYGILGSRLTPVLEAALAQYRQQSGDRNIALLALSEATPATMGARQHPGKLSHREVAKLLAEFLKKRSMF